jgi:hypothetical protein
LTPPEPLHRPLEHRRDRHRRGPAPSFLFPLPLLLQVLHATVSNDPCFPFLLRATACPRARRSDRSAPFRRRPPVRHDSLHKPHEHMRKRPCVIFDGRRGGREHRPAPTPASSRCAPPLSDNAAAAHRVHTFRAVGSRTSGPDHVPLRLKRAVHRGPVHQAHGAVHGARASPWPLDLRSTVPGWPF